MSTISINPPKSGRLFSRRRRPAPSELVIERRKEYAQYVAAAVVVLWLLGMLVFVMRLLDTK